MTFYKYDSKPILIDTLFTVKQSHEADMKPKGLWFTDDTKDNWRNWCVDNRFRLDTLTHKHEVEFDPTGVLFLNGTFDIFDFGREYGEEPSWAKTIRTFNRYVNWGKVAEKYKGIVITPYSWHARNEPQTWWYYSWDCASGCIWDVSIIKDIRLVEIDHDVINAKPSWHDEDAA